MKKLLRFFVHPTFLLILGLVLVSLLIWFGGPLIEIAKFAPLGPEIVRWVLIGLIVGFFVLRALWRWLRTKRLHTKLIDAMSSGPEEEPAAPSAGQQQVADLGVSFAKALEVLRNNPRLIKVQRNWFESAIARLRRQYLHDLPWYMIIGRPGSGKSTLLENSGLAFPLERALNTKRVRGMGGTRNCTWLFTDEAVLLDLAGRYTTHDSDSEADAEAWRGFLALLRKTRTPRPINGVIVAVSVQDLLRDEAQRREDATILSSRLHEIHEHLGIRFPVYIVVTQVDRLAGFKEYFATLDETARQGLWGITFPQTDKPGYEWLQQLPQEFDDLTDRLLTRLPSQMQQERGMQRRALIYAFPQEFAWNAHKLRLLLEDAFAPELHAHAPLVRGVYFTSAAQQGSPIDRVMGALARSLGLVGSEAPRAGASVGSMSFFIKKLMQGVIFAERDLAGTNLKAERRRAALVVTTYAATALITVMLIAGWTTSYFRNRSYVESVAANVDSLRPRLPNQLEALTMRVQDVMPLLDAVRELPEVPGTPTESPPWLTTLGLFQGTKLKAVSEETYEDMLRSLLLPRVAAHLRDGLRKGDMDYGSTYDRLKTYIMLHSPVHYKAEPLKVALEAELLTADSLKGDQAQRERFRTHLHRLIELGEKHPERFTLSERDMDQGAVTEARALLRGMTLPDRIYQRVRAQLRNQEACSDKIAFRVSDIVGPEAETLFTTADGRSRSAEMPAYYTKQCYPDAFDAELSKSTVDASAEEKWVMDMVGSTATTPPSTNALDEAVRKLYLQEYTRHWRALVDNVRLVHTDDPSRVMFTLNTLSKEPPDSPLPKLIAAIAEQTQFQNRKMADKFKSRFDKYLAQFKSPAKKVMPKNDIAASTKLEFEMVDIHFLDLHEQAFSNDDKKPAPIEAFPQLMASVRDMRVKRQKLVEANQDTAAVDQEIKTTLGTQAQKQKGPVKEIIDSIAGSCSASDKRGRQAQMAVAVESLSKWCRAHIADHYPFRGGQGKHVVLEDFETMFRPGGSMELFFKENLQNTETMGAEGQTMLNQFQRAEVIRNMYFKGGSTSTMSLTLRLKLVKADPSNLEVAMNIDGEGLHFVEGHPQRTINWPGSGKLKGERANLQFLPLGAGQSGILRSGPWALHELVDQAKQEPSPNGNLLLTFTLGSRSATFELDMPYKANPFNLPALEQFRCP